MEAETTCPVTSSIHLLTLSDTNPWPRKSQNVTTEESEVITTGSVSHLERKANGSVSLGTQNAGADVKENKPSKHRLEPMVVFMGHCDNEDERPEPLPEFTTLDFFSSNPTIVSASLLQWEDDDSISPESVDIDHDLQDEDDYMHWPESPPEFATVGYKYGMVPLKPVSKDLDESDLETNGIPSVPNSSFIERTHSKKKNESWALKNSEIGTPVLLEEGNTLTVANQETLPDLVDPQNRTIKHIENIDECKEDVNSSAVTNTPSNGTVSNKRLKMCPNHAVNAGYWVHGDDNGVCIKEHEDLGLSISDLPTLISTKRKGSPLQTTPAKKAKNKWITEMVIDESAFCLAGLNKSGPVSVLMI